jgi:hypothetical protein
MTLLKIAPNFSLLGRRRNEMEVAGKYYWAITQVAGQSRGSQSNSFVLVFGFYLGLPCAHILIGRIHIQLRLAKNPTYFGSLEGEFCLSRGVSVKSY